MVNTTTIKLDTAIKIHKAIASNSGRVPTDLMVLIERLAPIK